MRVLCRLGIHRWQFLHNLEVSQRYDSTSFDRYGLIFGEGPTRFERALSSLQGMRLTSRPRPLERCPRRDSNSQSRAFEARSVPPAGALAKRKWRQV